MATDVTEERIAPLLEELSHKTTLDFNALKFLLEKAYHLVQNKDGYPLGLKIICYIADSKPKDDFIIDLLSECFNESRIFLYKDMYKKIYPEHEKNTQHTIYEYISEQFYTLPSGTILTKPQQQLLKYFYEHRRIVVSAPTSFGKSRITQEIIINSGFNNIVIVIPTLALLNETYINFKNNKNFSQYNIVISTRQTPSSGKNLFIFTPERIDLYLDLFPELDIDFFVLDEVYKIANEDERSLVFLNALYRLSTICNSFYLIGPYFKNFSKAFLSNFKAKFIEFNVDIVQKEFFDLSLVQTKEKYYVSGIEIAKASGEDINVGRIVNAIDGQYLIYKGAKRGTESVAKSLSSRINEEQSVDQEFIDFISETIDPKWSLVNCLKKNVAFHHAGLPKYILNELVRQFNIGSIRAIVCSPTLMEGVNTSAKNVMILDKSKGSKTELSGFDVKNIKGRSGRFGQHFVGRVFNFVDELPESEIEDIPFNFFDKEELSFEENLLVKNNDLSPKELQNRKDLNVELNKFGIPIELVRLNKYVKVESQVMLILYLKNNPHLARSLHFSGSYPIGAQLDTIIELIFNYLFNLQEKEDRNFDLFTLKRFIKLYIYKNPSLKELITSWNAKTIDSKVRNIFKLIYQYFEFKLPKYFTAFQNLFNFTYRSDISLKYIITKLEYGSTNTADVLLKECGIPPVIINKISRFVEGCSDIHQISKITRENKSLINSLSQFELKMLYSYI